MTCAESVRVQAYFDGELDAVFAADIERHLENCAQCRTLLQDLMQVRTQLRDLPVASVPSALRSRLIHVLEQEGAAVTSSTAGSIGAAANRQVTPSLRVRSFWVGMLGGAFGTAIAATCAFLLLVPRFTNPLLDEITNAHVRSLMPAHLVDVISTDKHTVKPWFAGHSDVSPVVADFESQGYRLVGGRADYLDHQRSAVVVYQHGSHIINIFSWADSARALPSNVTRSGYQLIFWTSGDLHYCAVSDTGRDELLGLVRLLQDLGARNSQG